jgi:hypothetical protein
MTLIAEDLLLLLLDDETGRLTQTTYLDQLLGGAALIELATRGMIEVRKDDPSRWARAKVHPVAGVDPPEEPLLERKLALVAEKERTAQDLVGRLGKGMRQELLEDLAERGVVRRDHERVFGLFSVDRWPAVDSAHEARVRELLSSALLHGTTPDQRSAALISLLAAVDHAHKVIETHGVPAKEIRKRAKQIAEGEWAAKAVRDAVQAVQSAMVAVLVTTTVVTASGT